MSCERINQLLKDRGIKPAAFAREIGIPTSTIYSITRGQTKMENIGIGIFLKIARGLGMTAEELYYGTPPKPPTFSDPQQTALNGYYECMNDTGRKLAVDSVKAMSSSVELRMEKNSAERPADQTEMGA